MQPFIQKHLVMIYLSCEGMCVYRHIFFKLTVITGLGKKYSVRTRIAKKKHTITFFY